MKIGWVFRSNFGVNIKSLTLGVNKKIILILNEREKKYNFK